MSIVYYEFSPLEAVFKSTVIPEMKLTQGTNFPVPGLAFADAADEEAYFKFAAINYGSGNLTLTLEWYADSASTGDVVWGAAIAAITPNTDTQDIETKAFATAQTVTDSHLATVGQRLHSIDLTITNLDSIAVGDAVYLKVYRDADNVSDTMTGDAILTCAKLSYSDT